MRVRGKKISEVGVVERDGKPIISAKQVKTVIRCEQAYYYEYVLKKKVEKSEAMQVGLETHEAVQKNLEDKEVPIEERLSRSPAFRAVYTFLPKDEEPVVEKKMFFDVSGDYYRVIIPDILYSNAIYDLKTTRSVSASKRVYSDDVIQLHYYWETLGGNRDLYVIKLLLPNGESLLPSYQASLFKINIIPAIISEIHRAEGRVMEILNGSSPRPNPGRRCGFCFFKSICPYAYTEEGE